MDSQNMNPTPTPTPVYVPQKTEMSVGAWIGTLLLTCIPVVNLICLIVWAVSSNEDRIARRNWAIAQLLIMVIVVVLCFIFIVGVGVSVFGALY